MQALISWIAGAVGANAAHITLSPLAGATSSMMQLVSVGSDQYVLRQYTNRQWLQEEPDLPAHEAAVLTKAAAAELPAPRLVAVTGAKDGLTTPALLMTHIAGSVVLPSPDEAQSADFAVWLDRLAAALASIHRQRADDVPWQFHSWVEPGALSVPSWATEPERWEQAIAIWRGPPPGDEPVFIHRDYHPVNVLWRDGEVSGIVDWANACAGPAGVDVAHCRLNLSLMYGPEAAAAFLAGYRQHAPGYVHHPYWDIDGLLNTCLPRPVYYGPWQQFSFRWIDGATLQQRAEGLLRVVLG